MRVESEQHQLGRNGLRSRAALCVVMLSNEHILRLNLTGCRVRPTGTQKLATKLIVSG